MTSCFLVAFSEHLLFTELLVLLQELQMNHHFHLHILALVFIIILLYVIIIVIIFLSLPTLLSAMSKAWSSDIFSL